MIADHLHQRLATRGAFEFLSTFHGDAATASSRERILDMMSSVGVEQPQNVFNELSASGVLQGLGVEFGLSRFGVRAYILLEALNGGDLRLAFQRLSNLDSTLHTYELVREGMTDTFFENIHARPGFGRLYLCSPWVSLSDRNRNLLLNALHQAESRGERPEVIVLTRPGAGGIAPSGVTPLQDLGATVFLNHKLHTKLYIREPGRRGGYSMAIVGSQNLTRSRYLELGIRVNSDSTMVDSLISYFWSLSLDSVELGG